MWKLRPHLTMTRLWRPSRECLGIAAICPMMRVEDLGFEELKNQVISYIREV